MLIGAGAEEFAREQGLAFVPNSYFLTERRAHELQREIQKERDGQKAPSSSSIGTVGAVALDRAGNLAAATSTGGMTNKRYGRVGDSPIIGAGTYADNESCAVSCTGTGEFFIRSVVAYDICARVQYKQISVEAAVREVVHGKLKRSGGEGGVIAIDRAGHIAMEFNSVGMFRGARDSAGRRQIAIYADRDL
jgi:beta-aspartyl-peptidase (threonine type)